MNNTVAKIQTAAQAHSKTAARVHSSLHCLYFAGVFVEGHGVYHFFAGALLLVTVVAHLLHIELGE